MSFLLSFRLLCNQINEQTDADSLTDSFNSHVLDHDSKCADFSEWLSQLLKKMSADFFLCRTDF